LINSHVEDGEKEEKILKIQRKDDGGVQTGRGQRNQRN